MYIIPQYHGSALWLSDIVAGVYLTGSMTLKKKNNTSFPWIDRNCALSVILRYINIYGDSSHWSAQNSFAFTILSFLNVSKYPPSLHIYIDDTGSCIDLSSALTETH